MKKIQLITTFLILISASLYGQTFTQVTEGDIVTDGASSFGASWGDYSNDGFIDLFVANRVGNNFLFKNNGDGTFTKIITGDIVNDGGVSLSGSWGDYDNDGDLDLFVANGFDIIVENNFLYRNNGDESFTKITVGPVVTDGGNSTGGSWVDFNNDGDLDLFVTNVGANFLYQNNGDGTFTKITTGPIVADGSVHLGASWGDYDNDGDLDLFVANGFSSADNLLYQNDGNGTFTQIVSGIVVTDGGDSRGGSWGDYDNDGDLDLYVSNSGLPGDQFSFLYQNNGDGSFIKITTGSIVEDDVSSQGSSWGDYDNDGDLDLLVANSAGPLYQNNGDGTFTKITTGATVNAVGALQGCGWADYDNDGDLDFFIASDGSNNSLFRNDGNLNNWINIINIGTVSNTSSIGVKISVKANINGSDTWQLIEISAQTGYNGQNSLNAHFGLGDAEIIEEVRIEWPTGTTETFTNVAVNQFAIANESNAPPVGTNDPVQTNEDESIEIDILANDTDADGDELFYNIVDSSTNGELSIDENDVVTYTPNENYFGDDGFTYTVSDGFLGGTDNVTVSIVVNSVNDAPTFTKGEDITVLEDGGVQSMAWATGINDGDDEVTQVLSFEIVSVSNAALFSVQPAIANNGTLTFTSAPNENGTTTITIKLKDDGGTANGGNDESATESFDIIITPVNDAPIFTKGPDITVEEDAGAQNMAWATDIDDGDNEVNQVLIFEVTANSNTTLFNVQPAAASDGTLTFTPAPDVNGSATIDIKITDDGGTANGGVDESASQTFTVNITPVNDAPTVAVPIPDQNPIYEFTFTFDIGTFVDIEDSQLTYTATLDDDSLLPTWLTFDGLTRTFSGTPEVGEGSFIIKVTATDSGGLSVSDEFELNFLITGSEDPNFSTKMVLYPNPATGEIDLLIYDAYTGDINISVMDNNGRILFTNEIYKPAAELRHTIDLSGKSNGVYFIRVQTGNKETLLRAVKR